MPFHMADAGSDNFEQEFALDLMDSEKKMLKEITDALNRIGEGTFGVCEGKGESISKARLNAIPWARYCVACAELKEKGHRFGVKLMKQAKFRLMKPAPNRKAKKKRKPSRRSNTDSGS